MVRGLAGGFMDQAWSSRFGLMQVIGTDQFRGRMYRCPCGWEGWTTWGHAKNHADTCAQARPADNPPTGDA